MHNLEYRDVVSLEELLIGQTLSYGVVQPGSHVADGVPIIRVNNMKNGRIDITDVLKVDPAIAEKHKKTSLVGGELLITVVGALGETAIVPSTLAGWNTARAVAVAKVDSTKVDIDYLRYCFRLDDVKHQIYGNANTTVQPTLNLAELKRLAIPMRSLPEQRRIAGVLINLDDKINLLHQQNRTLVHIAETLYRQWFVEENDDRWDSLSIESLALVQNGYAFKSSEYIEDGANTYEVLKMGHIDPKGGLRTAPKCDYVPRSVHLKKWVLTKDDIVLAMTDMKDNMVILGVPALVDRSDHYVLNQRVARITIMPTSPLKHQLLLYYQMRDRDFIGELQSKSHGGVQVNLSTESIKTSRIIVPPADVQEKLLSPLLAFHEKMDNNTRQIRTLTVLRETLLPKLMSGEITTQHVYDTMEVCSKEAY